MRPARYLLLPDAIQEALDRHHLTHQAFADHLGLSRSYWSAILHRRQRLTPRTRRLLLSSAWLQSIPEAELWEVVPEEAAAEPAEGGQP